MLAFQHWQAWAELSAEQMANAFELDEAYRKQERGEISGPQYFNHLRQQLQLHDIDDKEMIAGWNSVFPGEMIGMRKLLQDVSRRLPCYLFSNTNATHQEQWMKQFPEVVKPLKQLFLSHEIGLRKPEPEAFQHISSAINVPLDRILFFDDLLENVQAACSIGMQAVRVSKPQDVAAALENLRLV